MTKMKLWAGKTFLSFIASNAHLKYSIAILCFLPGCCATLSPFSALLHVIVQWHKNKVVLCCVEYMRITSIYMCFSLNLQNITVNKFFLFGSRSRFDPDMHRGSWKFMYLNENTT